MNRILLPFVEKCPQLELIGFTDWCNYSSKPEAFGYRLQVRIKKQLIIYEYKEDNLLIHRFDCKNMTKYNIPSYSLVSCFFSIKYPVFASREVVNKKTTDAIADVLKIVSTLV